MALDQINADDYELDETEGNESRVKLKKSANDMSFFEHLEELRWHLIRSFAAILLLGTVFFLFTELTFEQLLFGPRRADFPSYWLVCQLSHAVGLGETACITPASFRLETIELGEQFTTHIAVAVILGFISAFPYIFWEIWRFIAPGLHDQEKNASRNVIAICTLLFYAGVAFGYFVVAPFAVNFLVGYTVADVETVPRLSSYVNYMVMFTVPCGLVFELPIVVYFLSKLGLVTPEGMREYRRHAVVAILVVAAVITPPDVVTQLIVSLPLFLLYEISIAVSGRVVKQLDREEKEAEKESA